MKKLKIVSLILLVVLLFTNVAFADVLNYRDPLTNANYADGNTTLDRTVKGVWIVIRNILQVTAVGVFLFAGIRYMMASADQKADIKNSMTILVIGAVITFAASTIIPYIVKVVDELL